MPTRFTVPLATIWTFGRSPATVVAEPVTVWAPDPFRRRVPVPPSKVASWVTLPGAARIPTSMLPLSRVTRSGTVRVVPAAIVLLPLPMK